MNRTVVYVVGKGRSGSTLLDDLLGSIRGVAALGEVRQLWSRGFTPGYRCACGELVSECPVWSTAVPAAIGDVAPASLQRAAALQAGVQSWPHLPRSAVSPGPTDRAFGAMMARLYDSVAETLDASILIDSSKWPLPAGHHGLTPGWQTRVLHLVRDPRAVAHSYQRVKGGDGQPELPRFGRLHSATSWSARNGVVELTRRAVGDDAFRRVRYEDLVDAPRDTVVSLGDWLGLEEPDRAFVDDSTVELGRGHLVGGNPRRFERGRITVRPDDEWVGRSGGPVAVLADSLTYPLRRRYRYAGNGAP